jgi:hypothetical protein
VAASAVSVAGASAAARATHSGYGPPSGGGVTSDYLTPTKLRKSESLPISPLPAGYQLRITCRG